MSHRSELDIFLGESHPSDPFLNSTTYTSHSSLSLSFLLPFLLFFFIWHCEIVFLMMKAGFDLRGGRESKKRILEFL